MSAVANEWEQSPSMRVFGAFVHGMRDEVGITREQLGKAVGLSRHTIASIEIGRRRADADFPDRAEAVLGDTQALRRALRFVVAEMTPAGWQERWAAARAEAISVCVYDNRVVPAALQTGAYAHALYGGHVPPLPDEEIGARWAERADEREQLTARPATAFSFVIDEHVLLRRTGGPQVTRDLAAHLLALADRRNVALQVLPAATSAHPGVWGPIALLESPQHRWLARTEAQDATTVIADRHQASALLQRHAQLRTQAMTPEATRTLLAALADKPHPEA